MIPRGFEFLRRGGLVFFAVRVRCVRLLLTTGGGGAGLTDCARVLFLAVGMLAGEDAPPNRRGARGRGAADLGLPVSWVSVALMELNGRGRRGASAPVPYI